MLEFAAGLWAARFRAMGSPCEVLVESSQEQRAQAAAQAAAACASRIECKFSRYRDDNVVARINSSNGAEVIVDEETANLLDYAQLAWQLSDGLFDITSGVLRRAWKFDGGNVQPSDEQIASLLKLVGWNRVKWERPALRLLPGMQIDFGGIGKEYAVDRALADARATCPDPVLVNFGGDLAVSGPRRDGAPWRIGIEAIGSTPRDPPRAARIVEFSAGALATSGDAYRFVTADGERFCHILDPRTGWPVRHAPRSITVAASTCIHAGMLTTMAMLQGPGAEAFLEREGVRHWVQRDETPANS